MKKDPHVFLCRFSYLIYVYSISSFIRDIRVKDDAKRLQAFEAARRCAHPKKSFQRIARRTYTSAVAGLSEAGGPGGAQFLADQLTLSQPAGHIIPTQYYVPPPYFRTLRRPWVGA